MWNKIKAWYRSRSKPTTAALRTALQSLLAALTIVVLSLIGAATNMLNGQAVDLAQELSNAGRLAALTLLGGFSALYAYLMNMTKEATDNDPEQPGQADPFDVP